ncbi:hypothetical protein Cabys_3220 [Caldithrix abyssi DSM 13497]|uniref:Uncharacterized protein n=1 Tax=Caldithrix abyssi DSM 13497 TaxID=880073 RepID=A0A1J1CDI8_CALAY|nr:hypothetical protein Cabys_3220 [Caldithrix abyssi DSM 13497]
MPGFCASGKGHSQFSDGRLKTKKENHGNPKIRQIMVQS